MRAAQLGDRGPVAIRRGAHTSRADHGFAEEGRDLPIVLGKDTGKGFGFVCGDADDPGHQLANARVVALDAGQAGAVARHAVVGALPHHDELAFGPPAERPIAPDQLGRGVDRFRATAGEEDGTVFDRRQASDPLGELEGSTVGQPVEAGAGVEPPHLRRRRFRQLGPAVAHVAIPEGGRGIDVALPRLVEQEDALSPIEHDLICCHVRHVGEGVPEPGGSRSRRCHGVSPFHTPARPIACGGGAVAPLPPTASPRRTR